MLQRNRKEHYLDNKPKFVYISQSIVDDNYKDSKKYSKYRYFENLAS